MRFDAVVGNPPYQAIQNSGNPIWQDFVSKAISLIPCGGRLAMVHPPRWRGFDSSNSGSMRQAMKALRSMRMEWISMHGIRDGERTFGASTAYDMYSAVKTGIDGCMTEIRDIDGMESAACIDGMEFISNSSEDRFRGTFAGEGEERVMVLHCGSRYHGTKEWMSKEELDDFPYPCLHSISKADGTPRHYWSSRPADPDFMVPKVVFGVGHQAGIPYVDRDGLAMTQYAAAIVDEPENLDAIAAAMNGDAFREAMRSVRFTTEEWNKTAISRLRRDFWKSFQ